MAEASFMIAHLIRFDVSDLRSEDYIVRMAGFSLGANVLFAEVTVGHSRRMAMDVAINTTGTVVVTYPGSGNSPNTQDVSLHLYDLTGNSLDDELVLPGVIPTQTTTSKITFLDNSNFVIVYGDESAGIGHTRYTQRLSL